MEKTSRQTSTFFIIEIHNNIMIKKIKYLCGYNFSKECDYINGRYDPVVSGLDFEDINIPENIIKGIEFDTSVYDEMEEYKGYKKFIGDNLVPELITFGQEYVGALK